MKKTCVLTVLIMLGLLSILSAQSEEKKKYANPFGEKINQQAKKIYKNSQNSWEADLGNGIVLVYIPPGDFEMGSNENKDEQPPHTVYLDGYWMGKTPVTVAQYKKFTSDTEDHFIPEWVSKYIPGDNHPAVWVSWEDAAAYCAWLSEKTGLHFKLPTEAQWEKASRGTDSRKYPWGNFQPSGKTVNAADKQLSLKEKAGWADKDTDDGYAYTAPVGSYPDGASPYGVLDMSGNVWDWCRDWFENEYYINSPKKNPTGPKRGRYHVVRGGSWNFDTKHLRCSSRFGIRPSTCNYDLGFRLCLEELPQRHEDTKVHKGS